MYRNCSSSTSPIVSTGRSSARTWQGGNRLLGITDICIVRTLGSLPSFLMDPAYEPAFYDFADLHDLFSVVPDRLRDCFSSGRIPVNGKLHDFENAYQIPNIVPYHHLCSLFDHRSFHQTMCLHRSGVLQALLGSRSSTAMPQFNAKSPRKITRANVPPAFAKPYQSLFSAPCTHIFPI